MEPEAGHAGSTVPCSSSSESESHGSRLCAVKTHGRFSDLNLEGDLSPKLPPGDLGRDSHIGTVPGTRISAGASTFKFEQNRV